jgi:hypothetical protein
MRRARDCTVLRAQRSKERPSRAEIGANRKKMVTMVETSHPPRSHDAAWSTSEV